MAGEILMMWNVTKAGIQNIMNLLFTFSTPWRTYPREKYTGKIGQRGDIILSFKYQSKQQISTYRDP